jgi:hypothetical protein
MMTCCRAQALLVRVASHPRNHASTVGVRGARARRNPTTSTRRVAAHALPKWLGGLLGGDTANNQVRASTRRFGRLDGMRAAGNRTLETRVCRQHQGVARLDLEAGSAHWIS